MKELINRFLKEIISEHGDINRVCDDYELEVTEDNYDEIKEMIELLECDERKIEELKKFSKVKIGDKWFMYGFDRNAYLYEKLLRGYEK